MPTCRVYTVGVIGTLIEISRATREGWEKEK